jgi:hypothetical protein
VKAGAAGLGGLAALALLLPMEAGVPIPLPADLVMFTVGERVAAGAFPLWLAVTGFEVISVLGTTALFLVCQGPAHLVIARFGPRLGPVFAHGVRCGLGGDGLVAGSFAALSALCGICCLVAG